MRSTAPESPSQNWLVKNSRPRGSTIADSSTPSPERSTRTRGGPSHNGTLSAADAPTSGETSSPAKPYAAPSAPPTTRTIGLVTAVSLSEMPDISGLLPVPVNRTPIPAGEDRRAGHDPSFQAVTRPDDGPRCRKSSGMKAKGPDGTCCRVTADIGTARWRPLDLPDTI